MKFTQFFIDRPLLVKLVSIVIIILGITVSLSVKRATYPDVDFDLLKITTTFPGASSEDVEVNVTKKIEDELNSVQGIDRIRSVSLENVSLLYVFIDLNASDTDKVKDDVRRAVDRVNSFPPSVEDRPQIQEIKSTNVAVIEVAVMGEVPERLLRTVSQDVEDQFNEVEGISSVEKIGYRKREVKILADLEKLRDKFFSLLNIHNTIKNRNINTSGGSLTTFSDTKKVVTFSEFETTEDVKDVILRSSYSGKQLKLKDVATVEDSYEKAKVIQRTNSKNSINLLIRAQANSDIIDISNRIKSLMERLKKTLPDGVELRVVSDFSYYTVSLLSIIKNNALIGIVLVVMGLMVFLNRVTAIWTAFGIPFSFLGAIIFFPLFGVSINFISMITLILVLGLLVDDAIVVAENITRHMEKGVPRKKAALIGAKEMFWPVTTTVITTIMAFIPIFFMTGVTGKFITEIPIVVILSLAFSLFECLAILPAHIALSKGSIKKDLAWFEKWKQLYGKMVSWCIYHRKKTITFFISFLMLSFGLFVFKGKFVLFPYDDVDLFYVIAELSEGNDIYQTSEKMKEVEKLVSEISDDEIVNFTTSIGHHNTNVYGANAGLHENWAMVTVYLKHSSERLRDSKQIMSELNEKIKKLSGFDKLYLEKFNDGPPVGKPVTISLVAKNDAQRRSMAMRVLNFIKSIPGVTNPDIDEKLGKKELRIIPDYEKMARLGISSSQIAQTLRAAFLGIVSTSITREGEDIDFRVQLKTKGPKEEAFIGELQIPSKTGELINLKNFSKVVERQGYELIRHYNGTRAITITSDIDENVTTSKEVNALIENKFGPIIEKTPGMRMYFGGEEKATQESLQSFVVAFSFALVCIYFVLILLFQSWVQPFIILAAVPFGLGGVFIVFFLHNIPVGFLALIGCLGLLGIIVNDCLVMVTHLNDLASKEALTHELIVRGAKDRMRAVLLTTFTTVVGMVPTIYGFGGSEPFIVPIVLAIAGGLIFATTITLFYVPVLYSLRLKS
ncbi:MAG: efflux RND transporter permease subunit [Bacteriovoracaceae bacterium]